MFNPFKKKRERYSDYIIDLGKLKDRGIIKEPIQQGSSITTDSSISTTQTDSNSLGFLGSMAASADATPVSGAAELPNDWKEKMNSISERLYRILDRIDLLEHKIERLERRSGFSENY